MELCRFKGSWQPFVANSTRRFHSESDGALRESGDTRKKSPGECFILRNVRYHLRALNARMQTLAYPTDKREGWGGRGEEEGETFS